MPRPGPTTLSRPAMLALAMLVWCSLPLGARPAAAAGCHAPDRPILGVNPPGHAGRHIAAWAMPDGGEVAPPSLTRPPCPGETPRVPVISAATIGPACLATVAPIPTVRSGSPPAVEGVESLDPHPFRLDRPPR